MSSLPSIEATPNGLPPMGVVFGPHPPCTLCGSEGWPADIEISFKGRDAWLCLDCYRTKLSPEIRGACPVDVSKALALRDTAWSRSWRGWKRTTRENAIEQPTLVLP